ncbi:hypothetical protein [Paraburkholderia aromaticivorans]|uniref:Uncharacterized protein n=1 Tax=Paraburkholderia aromaticivorans TaxID=2026199 RepID=A0A248VCN1_9BURK|nr:hypothetical protein [Paraburkholderia aromaticivorans]ASV96817.1 hypothetical protein CJU94_00690 [Paraburkholderia aromaticivorans]
MLRISIFDGDFHGTMEELTHVCDIEGCVIPDDRPPFSLLEESLRVLEMCVERYTVPRPRGPCFTVFIGRMNGTEMTIVVRLDIFARDGLVRAGVEGILPGWDAEPTHYLPDDDVVTIVRKLIAGQLPK